VGWLREGFVHPERAELIRGHHLRPIRAADVDIDFPAVMGSRETLWERFGRFWSWPAAEMTYEDDRRELEQHEAEMAAQEAFNYAILNRDESALLGCVYVDPPMASSPNGTDAVVSWWVVDPEVGSPLDRALQDFVPRWLEDVWGFSRVQFGIWIR
jgi:hypothetical protein